MIQNQALRPDTGVIVESETDHGGSCNFLAAPAVAIKMTGALFIKCKAIRLATVMKQQGRAHHGVGGSGRNRPEDMAPHIQMMIPAVLGKAEAGRQLRQRLGHHLQVSGKGRLHPVAQQRLLQLRPHPLRRNRLQQGSCRCHGCGRGRVDGKLQGGRKPHPSQDAQGIFHKAGGGVADTGDPPLLQIPKSMEGVGQTGAGMVSHCVDREIAAAQIQNQIPGEGDAIRPPVIGICPIHPKGCHLKGLMLHQHGNGAVLAPGFNH